MSADVATIPSLEDLDLLDDGQAHCACTFHQAPPEAFQSFVALCGRKAVSRNGGVTDIPENACDDCLRLYDEPCAVCGWAP